MTVELKKNNTLSSRSIDELLDRLLSGDSLAVSRLITLIENDDPGAREAIKRLYKHGGQAHIVGITGSVGTGKSTLIGKLASLYRKRDKTVGIIAVDPSSPITGGALLGDRVRMHELSGDRGIFIRSMGTRGSSGGLAIATNDVISILDAFKKDIIIVETIGVGQDEIEIENFVHTLIIVTMPGGGDAVQSIKAGILEVGDIYVVNKADRPEAPRAISELEFMLEMERGKEKQWKEPIVQTVATMNKGIDELIEQIEAHHTFLVKSGKIDEKRTRRSQAELTKIINRMVTDAVEVAVGEEGSFRDLLEKMALTGEVDPYTAAEIIFAHLMDLGSERNDDD
jgi:LAO/AO transport system kinase